MSTLSAAAAPCMHIGLRAKKKNYERYRFSFRIALPLALCVVPISHIFFFFISLELTVGFFTFIKVFFSSSVS